MSKLNQEVLKLLSKQDFLSGQKMATELGISRTAVWKAVKSLREEGYTVESVTNKGYKLVAASSELNETLLTSMVKDSSLFSEVIYKDSVDSTQKLAFGKITDIKEPFIVVAGEQTEGRGRFNREWASPEKRGLYMSAVFKPDIYLNEIIKFNLFISLAIANAIEKSFNLDAGIKWPNDIYINGRKVCGFLTEVISENNMIQSIICGIGLNLYHTEDISKLETATSIEDELKLDDKKDLDMESFLKQLIIDLEKQYDQFINMPFSSIREEWISKSIIFGKEMRISEMNRTFMAKPVDITDEGFLLAADQYGETHKIISADIEF